MTFNPQTFAHNYCVELSNARINRFSDGFFPSTSRLWNSLPFSVFPAFFNLPSFKRHVYHHLRDQMAQFFSSPFLDILQNCFILFITFLLLFLRDADLRKGTLFPFCIPIHEKKKKKKMWCKGWKLLSEMVIILCKMTIPRSLKRN